MTTDRKKKPRALTTEEMPTLTQAGAGLWRRSTSRKGITLMCPKCAVAPARAGKDFRYGGRAFKIRFGPGVENKDGMILNKDVPASEYVAYVKCNNGCMFTLDEFKAWIAKVNAPTTEQIAHAKSKEPRGGAGVHGPLPGQEYDTPNKPSNGGNNGGGFIE